MKGLQALYIDGTECDMYNAVLYIAKILTFFLLRNVFLFCLRYVCCVELILISFRQIIL